jgi:urea transport system permease protein
MTRILTALLLLFTAAGATMAQDAGAAGPTEAETAPAVQAALPTDLDGLLAALPDADLAGKQALIQALAAEGSHAAQRTLRALLEGRLSYRTTDKLVVAAEGDTSAPRYIDVKSEEEIEADSASTFSRITINNQIRRSLRSVLATLELASDDADVRRGAVREMMRTMDAESAALLRPRLEVEEDPRIRTDIATALAMVDVDSPDAAVRLAAVKTLHGHLLPEVHTLLTRLATPGEDGSYAEPDPAVRKAAEEALRDIEGSRRFYATIEMLFFGLSLGSVLVLAGIGLAITFGVMGVINMAHGELMMIGAYTVYVVQQLLPDYISSSILIAIPLAFLVSGLVGVAIERGVVRFLYGRPLETLLATFGVSLLLQQLVRDIFSPNNRPVQTPGWMAGSWQVNEVLAITWSRIYIVLFAALVFIALVLVLKRTSLGLHVRAVSQNRAMARAMGIRTDWVDALTFGLGAGIAGVAGVALSQLTNVGPNLGQSYIVDSFMVVVFGGVGNLWGTLISGLSLGVANKLFEPIAGAVLAKILILVALILFIQRRPRGLFPQKGRAAES